MKNMEDRLIRNRNFIRVHKSYMLNLDHVTEVDGNAIRVKGHNVTIGNTYRDEVNAALDRLKLF